MKKVFYAFAILIACFQVTAFAYVSEVVVSGILVAFDSSEKIATIKTQNGNAIVPLSSLPKLDGYIIGKAQVLARVNPNEFARLNMRKAKQIK